MSVPHWSLIVLICGLSSFSSEASLGPRHPLVRAIQADRVEEVHRWIRHPSQLSETVKIKPQAKWSESIFHWAAAQGSIRTVDFLLRAHQHHRVPINWNDQRGTPLLVSLASLARTDNPRSPKLIAVIDRILKADPGQLFSRDRAYVGDGRTALHQAASHGNVNLLWVLVAQVPRASRQAPHDTKTDNRSSSLTVQAYLDSTTANGETALHFAARNGSISAVHFLMAMGANPNRSSRHTRATPLMVAAEMGHEKVRRVLEAAGAQSHRTDVFGKTAFDRMVEYRTLASANSVTSAKRFTHSRRQRSSVDSRRSRR